MRKWKIGVPRTPVSSRFQLGGWQVSEQRPQGTPCLLFKAEPCLPTLAADWANALSKQMLSSFNLWEENAVWKDQVLSALQ